MPATTYSPNTFACSTIGPAVPNFRCSNSPADTQKRRSNDYPWRHFAENGGHREG
jgi:hypothetical protein